MILTSNKSFNFDPGLNISEIQAEVADNPDVYFTLLYGKFNHKSYSETMKKEIKLHDG